MKTPTLLIALAVTAATAVPALAGDSPGKDWMPIGEVVKTLEQNGYSKITEIEADDGHWEGEAVKDGKRVEFEADPRTGAITKEKVKGSAKAVSSSSDSDDDDDD